MRSRKVKPTDYSVLFKEGKTWRQSREFLKEYSEIMCSAWPLGLTMDIVKRKRLRDGQ